MKTSTPVLAIAILLAIGASFLSGWVFSRKAYRKNADRPDTVVVEKWIRDTIPWKTDSVRIETRIVYLPKAVHDTAYSEIHDTTTIRDSVPVEVPIVEKTYEGENYKATIRGFNPELIDIWVRQKETTITIPYRKRWGVTAGPQVGVGITPQGLQPYAGVGVTFGYSF